MGLTIDFSSKEDLSDLLVITKVLVDRQKEGLASFDLQDFSLEETAGLISAARLELQKAKELKAEQLQRRAQVGQQRESISTLDDRNAERQQKIWAEEAKAQAELYASEKNAGRGGRVYVTAEEKSIRDGVISWIDRMRKRGHKL